MTQNAAKKPNKTAKPEDQWLSYPLLCVLDLECTCGDDGSIPPDRMETIEIGAYLVQSPGFDELASFSTFVKPSRNPVLTPFCQTLTNIRQGDVDGAPDFPAAFAEFVAFCSRFGPTMLASWGGFDHRQLARESKQKSVLFPFNEHLNLKAVFRKVTGLKHEVSLERALSHAGLTFEGTPHRALVDSRNTVRLLPYLREKGLPR